MIFGGFTFGTPELDILLSTVIQVEEISDLYCFYSGAASCSEAFQWKVAAML